MIEARDTSNEPEGDGFARAEDDLDVPERYARIRCPRCRWRPGRDDLWQCHCGHTWNTFDTAGRCPACEQQWEWTQCLRCSEWSRHRDWYEEG